MWVEKGKIGCDVTEYKFFERVEGRVYRLSVCFHSSDMAERRRFVAAELWHKRKEFRRAIQQEEKVLSSLNNQSVPSQIWAYSA